jgi:diaminopimelate decarboxylase
MALERDTNGNACFGQATLANLLSEAGAATPAYVYDLDAIEAGARAVVSAAGGRHIVAYAVKANSAGTIIKALANVGMGADLVSGGELEVALACGVPVDKIFISGVAKTDAEIDHAIQAGVRAIQAESVEEIDRIAARAAAQSKTASISLRVNPSVMIASHAHIATGHDKAKFGIAIPDLDAAWQRVDATQHVNAVGVSTHVGSMLAETDPYVASGTKVCEVAQARLAAGGKLDFVDFGGGYGIDLGDGVVSAPSEFVEASVALKNHHGLEALTLVVEPGRSIVGSHGVVVARVLQTKQSGERRWAMIDAGMNDVLRPALYGARHRIEPLDRAPSSGEWRVVGPVCESADDFGDFNLGETAPESVVIRDTGAYGFSMASEYNGRALPAEIFVSGGRVVAFSPSRGASEWARSRLNA